MEITIGAASGSWNGSAGLRTARQRKRAAYGQWERELRRLHRQRSELWQALRSLPMVPLDPPVQKGWIRFFELREDQRHLATADFYRGILSRINNVLWSWKPDFKVRRRHRGRKIYVDRPQQLRALNAWQFRRAGFTEEERALFQEESRLDECGRLYVVYRFSEAWRYTLRIAPNLIDKVRQRDAELDSRLQQLENHLERRALAGPMSNLLGNRHRWYRRERPSEKTVNPLHNRSLAQVLTALAEEIS